MAVSLTSNFLQNARGLTLADGGGITWSIDLNTNKITGTTTGGTTNTILAVKGIGVWNSSAPASQPTGYGTPTGAALTSSFAAGSITLAQLAAEVAQLILDLKKYGFIAA